MLTPTEAAAIITALSLVAGPLISFYAGRLAMRSGAVSALMKTVEELESRLATLEKRDLKFRRLLVQCFDVIKVMANWFHDNDMAVPCPMPDIDEDFLASVGIDPLDVPTAPIERKRNTERKKGII